VNADTIPTSTLPTILRAAESLETLDLYAAVIGGTHEALKPARVPS
jgi:hypothetical protein